MNERGELPTQEDVAALAAEVRELKEVLREVSGKLGRIEKRLRFFFPDSFPGGSRKGKEPDIRENPPSITPQQALDLYSELVRMARSGQEQEVEARVTAMSLADLALLVKELGAPLGKKPSRTGLTKSLMGRLKESIMLSRHTSRPGPDHSVRQGESAPLGEDAANPEETATDLTGADKSPQRSS